MPEAFQPAPDSAARVGRRGADRHIFLHRGLGGPLGIRVAQPISEDIARAWAKSLPTQPWRCRRATNGEAKA
jgi:hypothetical protein